MKKTIQIISIIILILVLNFAVLINTVYAVEGIYPIEIPKLPVKGMYR